MQPTRRQFLGIAGTTVAGATAGCVDLGLGPSSDAGTQASFYLLYDLARQVAADEDDVDSVVPFGQHGHGWDGPTAGQQRDVYTADLFVYMAEGFQPWADDVVDTIESDGEDVETVAAREGIELIPFDEHSAEHGHDDHDHEIDDGHDHGGEEDSEHDGEDGHDTGGGDGHDHDHDGDPHFWLDPRRTKQAVRNVRDGFVTVDPDGEDGYHERVEDHLATLDDLHHEFEDALADAERDAVLVAGHDAFGYLGSTYGFDVHGLTGLSPDEGISAAARREAEAVIEEHDVEHVLHPVLEPREHAETLVADTSASEVLDVTAISGVTDEWAEDEVGYVELMRDVNLPAFRTALGGQ